MYFPPYALLQMPELADTFRKMKDSPDKDTAKIFNEKILPLYLTHTPRDIPHLDLNPGIPRCSMNGSLRRSRSHQPGLQVVWLMGERRRSCRWSDSFLGSWHRAFFLLLCQPACYRLGDRHCENILLDINTGDVVHVDFNCLFEKVCDSLSLYFLDEFPTPQYRARHSKPPRGFHSDSPRILLMD